MRRRHALLSASGLLPLAGCLDTGRRRQARLAWLWLVNDRDEPYEIDVAVEDDGESVYSKRFELGTEAPTANINVETPVSGFGDYVVRATMDGETRVVDTTDVIDGDENCVGVRFTLLNNGSVDYSTDAMQEC